MEINWVYSRPYRACEWICRMVYLNMLWLMATILGLILFGVFPATVAMLTVMRKWLLQEINTPIFSTFAATYKKEFLRSNGLGLMMAAAGFIIYLNFSIIGAIGGAISFVLLAGLISTAILYVIALLFVFPTYVHYELKLTDYIKAALVLGIRNPLVLMALILSLILLYFLFNLVPGLMPFFIGSATGLILMWFGSRSFKEFKPN